MKHDTELQALVEQNSNEIESYLYLKLNIKRETLSNDSHILLWSLSFDKFSKLLPTSDNAIFNWPLFFGIHKFLNGFGIFSTGAITIDELCLH